MARKTGSGIGSRGGPGAPPLTRFQWEPVGLVLSARSPLQGSFVDGIRHAISPGESGPEWDMHLRLEIGVVLSGRMRRLYSSWETDLASGQVWFCGPWERHGWEVLTPKCEHLVLTVLPGVLARGQLPEVPEWDWMAPFAVPPRSRPQARGEERLEVLALTRRFQSLLRHESPDGDAAVGVFLLQLILLLTQHWTLPMNRKRGFRSEDFDPVSRAVQIALKTRKPVSTQQAARAVGMSYRAFSRAFRAIMGIPFAGFALGCRLSRSAADLRDSDAPVSEIADRWGFPDPSSYARCFSRHHGVTPTRYRLSHGAHPRDIPVT
jgi:AraC-like DNA-binding protein/quercetin dioxygenase-like cupin family protein